MWIGSLALRFLESRFIKNMKIEIEEKTEYPGLVAPRAVGWLAAIIGAPFSGGLSLLVGGVMEVTAWRSAKQEAREHWEQKHGGGREDVYNHLYDAARKGAKTAEVSSSVVSDGYGVVRKKFSYRIVDGD
jgi:hypothetical protein